MYKHILVPTDGSELSQNAVRGAVHLASGLGAQITGFFAAEEYPLPAFVKYPPWDLIKPEAFRAVQEATAGWTYDRISIGFPGPVRNGRAAREPWNLGPGWVRFDFEKRPEPVAAHQASRLEIFEFQAHSPPSREASWQAPVSKAR